MSNNKDYVIAVDAMGGDNAPFINIQGAVDAVNQNPKIKVVLVGQEEVISNELDKYSNKYNKEQITIRNATQVIDYSDTPTVAIKQKKDSSIVVGLNMLKKGEASAFISAGSTGALLVGATLIIKRIKGVERPALASLLPAKKRHTFLIDSGANMDSKPSYLPSFAIIGKIYMQNIMNVEDPKIGLVNVGTEDEKGDAFTKEAFKLLKKTPNINFVGNIEGRDIPEGNCDIVVCDGFVGNVILKVAEGTVQTFSSVLKEQLKSSFICSIGALFSKSAFLNIKKKFDYAEIGGAPFLGLKSLVIKAHGSSNAKAITSSINQCYKFIESDIIQKIEDSIGTCN
ncbi:MAG: phosphate acyltransferase PlsX [bacterium]